MDDFILQNPSDSEKEWKQRIQYELNGIEYNNLHVKDNFEKIHTKPFYTSSDSLKISSQYCRVETTTISNFHPNVAQWLITPRSSRLDGIICL